MKAFVCRFPWLDHCSCALVIGSDVEAADAALQTLARAVRGEDKKKHASLAPFLWSLALDMSAYSFTRHFMRMCLGSCLQRYLRAAVLTDQFTLTDALAHKACTFVSISPFAVCVTI